MADDKHTEKPAAETSSVSSVEKQEAPAAAPAAGAATAAKPEELSKANDRTSDDSKSEEKKTTTATEGPKKTNDDPASDDSKSDLLALKKVSFNDNHISLPEKLSNPPSDDNLVKSPSILKPVKPPAKPPRPLSPKEQAKKTLKEAFPSIEEKYVIAVLIASDGDLDPAFNALLYLSDPNSHIEIPEPKTAKPPVPPKSYQRSLQLEEDERLARRLAREFNQHPSRPPRPARPARSTRPGQQQQQPSRHRDSTTDDDEDPDVLNSFLDEDLPQIKKQFEKGFEETKQKFGTFFSGFTKQFQDFNDSNNVPNSKPSRVNRDDRHENYGFGNKNSGNNSSNSNNNSNNNSENRLFGALGSLGSPPTSARSSATFRRDRNYDDDLDDVNHQYSTITLTNNDKDLPDVPIVGSKIETNQSKPSLEKKNSTDLYGTPKISSGQFDDSDRPAEVNNKKRGNTESNNGNGNSNSNNNNNNNKWEPLTDVAPVPVTDDAFLVTSSDDEDDDEPQTKQSEKK